MGHSKKEIDLKKKRQIDLLRKLTRLFPNEAYAWMKLGEAYNTAHDQKQSIAAFKQAIQLAPLDFISWMQLGKACLFGNTPEAIRAFERATEIDPHNGEAWNRLGSAFYIAKDYQNAIRAFRRLTELGPDNHASWLSLAGAYEDAKQFPNAIYAYGRALELLYEPYGLLRLADCQWANDQRSKAIATCRMAIEAVGYDFLIWDVLGSYLIADNRISEAFSHYTLMNEQSPTGADGFHGLALCYQRRGQIPESINCINTILANNPYNPHTYYREIADLYHKNGQVDEAISAYHKAGWDGSAQYFMLLGKLHRQAGRFSVAVAQLRDALNISPDFYEAWRELGDIYINNGQLPEAFAPFESVIANKEINFPAWHVLGDIYQHQGLFQEAIVAYNKAVFPFDGNAAVYVSMGNTYQRHGFMAEAISSYLEATTDDPTCIQAWRNLGDLYRQERRMSDAIAAYRKIIEIDPLDEDAWKALATSFHNMASIH